MKMHPMSIMKHAHTIRCNPTVTLDSRKLFTTVHKNRILHSTQSVYFTSLNKSTGLYNHLLKLHNLPIYFKNLISLTAMIITPGFVIQRLI